MSYTYMCKIVWHAAEAGAAINPREVLAETHPHLFTDWPEDHWSDTTCLVDGEMRQALVFTHDYLSEWSYDDFKDTTRLRDAAEEPLGALDSEIAVLARDDWDFNEVYTNFGRRNGRGTTTILQVERRITVNCGQEPCTNE